MARARKRGLFADLSLALVAVALIAGYIWVLTRATAPVVTTLSFLSEDRARIYAGLLAVLSGLSGLLLTLPRAMRGPPPPAPPVTHHRRNLRQRSDSHLGTDLLGVAALLLAQVPLPAPWGMAGKAATIANITRSAEIVRFSTGFAKVSIAVFAVGLVAAVIAKVYRHAIGLRLLAIALAVAAPVLGWYYATETMLG